MNIEMLLAISLVFNVFLIFVLYLAGKDNDKLLEYIRKQDLFIED